MSGAEWAANPHYVYECRSAGQLVYIGCTNNPDKRLVQLRRTAAWWTEDTILLITHAFANRREAYQFEHSRIVAERPPMNVQGLQSRKAAA